MRQNQHFSSRLPFGIPFRGNCPMAPVRIALIGSGIIGRRHIEALKTNPEKHVLAAIADPASAAERLASELSVPHYASHEPLLDRENPDGVIIATPNQLHCSVGI